MLLYSDSRLSGADTVNGGLPIILDGSVYISLLEQLGVRKKWKQWWVLQLDIEVLLLVIKVVMLWHFVNDVCKVLWPHTLSGCLQTIVIIVLKISSLQFCRWWMANYCNCCFENIFLCNFVDDEWVHFYLFVSLRSSQSGLGVLASRSPQRC